MNVELGFFSKDDARAIAKHVRRYGKAPALNRRGRQGNSAAGLQPVVMTQQGGSNGGHSSAASWTYSVVHAITGEEIYSAAKAIDPTTENHLWQRPTLGSMIAATAGLGFWKETSADNFEFLIIFCNEQPGPGAC